MKKRALVFRTVGNPCPIILKLLNHKLCGASPDQFNDIISSLVISFCIRESFVNVNFLHLTDSFKRSIYYFYNYILMNFDI